MAFECRARCGTLENMKKKGRKTISFIDERTLLVVALIATTIGVRPEGLDLAEKGLETKTIGDFCKGT